MPPERTPCGFGTSTETAIYAPVATSFNTTIQTWKA